MLPDKNIKCHETCFAKTCLSIVSKGQCRKWVKIDGLNPNTGEPMHKFDCVDAIMPFLMIENSQQQRQTGAAVESFRNKVLEMNVAGVSVVNELLNNMATHASRVENRPVLALE